MMDSKLNILAHNLMSKSDNKDLKLKRVDDLIQETSLEKLLGTDYYNQNQDRLKRLSIRLDKLQEIRNKLIS